jgi:hypothetical protein
VTDVPIALLDCEYPDEIPFTEKLTIFCEAEAFTVTNLIRIALQATGSVTVQAVVLVATVSFLITCEVTEALGRVEWTRILVPAHTVETVWELRFSTLNSYSVSTNGVTSAFVSHTGHEFEVAVTGRKIPETPTQAELVTS